MNYRDKILKIIKGQSLNHILFVPRLDLWYKSNKIKDTLPNKYKDFTLKDITRDLGVGFHSVIPDFRNFTLL